MRSSWKAVGFRLRKGLVLRSRSDLVFGTDIGNRVLVSRGNKLVSLLVRPGMLYAKYGEFILSKKLGTDIHADKRKKVKVRK